MKTFLLSLLLLISVNHIPAAILPVFTIPLMAKIGAVVLSGSMVMEKLNQQKQQQGK